MINAPINANPHYSPPGQYQGTVSRFEAPGVGDLTNLYWGLLGDTRGLNLIIFKCLGMPLGGLRGDSGSFH